MTRGTGLAAQTCTFLGCVQNQLGQAGFYESLHFQLLTDPVHTLLGICHTLETMSCRRQVAEGGACCCQVQGHRGIGMLLPLNLNASSSSAEPAEAKEGFVSKQDDGLAQLCHFE